MKIVIEAGESLSSVSNKFNKAISQHLGVPGAVECPHCGCVAEHEDNGARGSELSFLCVECGELFDAEEV